MFVQIVNLILPIAVSLALGMIGRRRGWFGAEGINAFKNIVSKVMLPLVLFERALPLFFAAYSDRQKLFSTPSLMMSKFSDL